MRFNWDEFKNKYNKIVAHCKTEVECEVLRYGLGKADLEIAAEEMMLLKSSMNR